MWLQGFGRHGGIDAQPVLAASLADCRTQLLMKKPFIVRGAGCSYGDSSLAVSVLAMTSYRYMLNFDAVTGILAVTAGVTVADILHVMLPKGWCLPVLPGTRFVTVGGAIAANVHGKNHPEQGHFSMQVHAIHLMLGNGEMLVTSRTQHPALFAATCGGMGLTGIIVYAELQLIPVCSSKMVTQCIPFESLSDFFMHLHGTQYWPYRVSWIDVMTRGRNMGRGILTLGAHHKAESASFALPRTITVPCEAPDWFINRYTQKALNAIWYALHMKRLSDVHISSFHRFFFPLDGVQSWNKLHGSAGFFQYQCVLPLVSAEEGIIRILQACQQAGLVISLAVLKVFGKHTAPCLTFPMEGITLAMDIKATTEARACMDMLDDMVRDYNGRVYLAKDVRLSPTAFQSMYPEWEAFQAVRAQYHALGVFASLQSVRLGLDAV